MKPKQNEPKNLSNSPVQKGRKSWTATLVYTEEDAENAKKAMAEFLAKWGQEPVGGRMVLTNEIGIKLINPIWLEVDGSIRELDPGHFNSFACLSARGNNFIQCLRGFNGYHLEWRGSGNAFLHFHQFFQLGLKLGILAGGDHQAAHRTMVPHAQPFRNPAVCHRRSFSQQ